MTSRYNGRLDRVERETAGPYGRCPDCPPVAYIGEGDPVPVCGTCGGPHDGIIRAITVVRPDDADDPREAER